MNNVHPIQAPQQTPSSEALASLQRFAADYMPKRYAANDDVMQKFHASRQRYIEAREHLRDIATKQQRMKKTAEALREEAKQAGEAWRQRFRDNEGSATKEVRTLQMEERTALAELEQVEAMIAEMDPRLEELKIMAYIAQIEYRLQHSAAFREMSVSAVCQIGAGADSCAELVALLPRLTSFARDEVISDAVFMATRGYAGDQSRSYEEGFFSLPTGVAQDIRDEANRRLLGWIGAALVSGMQPAEEHQWPEELQWIEREPFEARAGEYGSVILGAHRRLKQLKSDATE